MRDIAQRQIPVLNADSGIPGPVVWLTACIHGDEVGGVAVVHDVVAAVRKSGLRCGSVRAVPLVNSMGFETVSRFFNSDREDLNRCFPGRADGTMGQQVARRLFDTMSKSAPSLVIDIHNDWVRSIPYILIEAARSDRYADADRAALRLARAAGLLLVADPDTYQPTHNTLSGALMAAGVPAFTFICLRWLGSTVTVSSVIPVMKNGICRPWSSCAGFHDRGRWRVFRRRRRRGLCHGCCIAGTAMPRHAGAKRAPRRHRRNPHAVRVHEPAPVHEKRPAPFRCPTRRAGRDRPGTGACLQRLRFARRNLTRNRARTGARTRRPRPRPARPGIHRHCARSMKPQAAQSSPPPVRSRS